MELSRGAINNTTVDLAELLEKANGQGVAIVIDYYLQLLSILSPKNSDFVKYFAESYITRAESDWKEINAKGRKSGTLRATRN